MKLSAVYFCIVRFRLLGVVIFFKIALSDFSAVLSKCSEVLIIVQFEVLLLIFG